MKQVRSFHTGCSGLVPGQEEENSPATPGSCFAQLLLDRVRAPRNIVRYNDVVLCAALIRDSSTCALSCALGN